MSTVQIKDWAIKTSQDFGKSIYPKERENWEQLYQRLHETIFSSPHGILHRAAALGCERTVQRLVLQEGHDVDELDQHGNSPLVHAIWENAFSSVEILLRLQANIEKKYNIWRPLEYALAEVNRGEENAAEIANLIIQKTPKLKPKILMDVAVQGNKIGLNLLLARGFNINLADKRGTVLHYLVDHDTDKVRKMEWLIRKGADVNIPNQDGETPLHHAMGMHAFECINLLLDHGADLFAVDKNGNSCLSWALFNGPPDYVIKRDREELAREMIIWGLRAAPYALRLFIFYKKYIRP